MAHGLSCSDACGILVPAPGIKPVSSELVGEFLTIGPLGRSLIIHSYSLLKVCLEAVPSAAGVGRCAARWGRKFPRPEKKKKKIFLNKNKSLFSIKFADKQNTSSRIYFLHLTSTYQVPGKTSGASQTLA